MIAAKIDAAVKAVCPIYGVSVGNPADKSTWSIDFKPEATAPQRAAAQAAIDAFDLTQQQADDQAVAAREGTDATECDAIKQDAQVTNFLNMTPAQLDTWIGNNIEAAPITLAQLKSNLGTALKVLGRLAQQGARGRRLR